MAEKEVKKTTPRKPRVKKEETVNKVDNKNQVDINNVSPELMQQMFAMFQSMMTQQQVEVAKPIEEKVVEERFTRASLRKIKDEEVPVRSCIKGSVSFKSPKTGVMYNWTDIDDEEYLTIEELLQMESTSKRFLHSPWLMIDDDRVIEGLGLGTLYNAMEKIKDVDRLLEENEISDIEKIIEKAPYEYKQNLSSIIFEKVENKEIRDLVLIRKLEEILGTTFLY